MDPVVIESPDEVLLKELCYLPTGIKQLSIGPDGGFLTLGSGDASLEFPAGAVLEETSVHCKHTYGFVFCSSLLVFLCMFVPV